ncbi:unnamed protein product [Brachionus calyciflorus]|uniref:MULE transposase domain-containing protein n=1 Tax=Brachionus calyciflorus TaxID=104777 RepID=A0A814J2F3_9BILA|nr:unnamed protein product [Brachionus calyciflorus]
MVNNSEDLLKLDSTTAFSFACDIKTGSDKNHCFIFFTSKKLLESINSRKDGAVTIFHLDCTYKINNNRFPIISFGHSDMDGQFHLVCLAITSHETEQDFRKLYQALIYICILCEIKFQPSFIMQDGCIASYNARETISYQSQCATFM